MYRLRALIVILLLIFLLTFILLHSHCMSRNYGIGSRVMADAGRMVVDKKFHGGYQSKSDISQRWGYFSKWAALRDVKKMENVTPELVIEYGRSLQAELAASMRISSSAPKNYVSAVNTVMKLATNNVWKTIRPGKDCGIQPRVYIPVESKAMSDATHQTAVKIIGDRVACLMELQRAFGLRYKESCLLSPKVAIKEAIKYGRITLRAGTKGGKQRQVTCRPSGMLALEAAVLIQDGRSMIPASQTYKQFHEECYAQARIAGIIFHSERHHYAQSRYRGSKPETAKFYHFLLNQLVSYASYFLLTKSYWFT